MDTPSLRRVQYFARPGGHSYHVAMDCRRLVNGAFEAYGYGRISGEDIRKLKLAPCSCVVHSPDE